ncbi:transmembrane protein 265 isoform X2 [Tachysurus fulvidraco]|uniref:transmembrane protein 265 isoform X2 n=1 Tax=Tachysurus fulvidraco TaxID=1234273 RepID=UPI000F4F9F25|nr:transmembrane protein 265 isoform X2 [Tachysurus fulvidraco]
MLQFSLLFFTTNSHNIKMLPLNHEPTTSTPLTTITHSGDVERGPDDQHQVRDYRKLAICSIICGLSCVGIVSLIYSVKTRELNKKSGGEPAHKAKEYSKKTLRWALGAIVALVGFIILVILLVGLLSYLLTFIN